MQIHEIFRRRVTEGILKGVNSGPVNFGRTTVAMPQQSVAPSKVTFAPNMMTRPAPAPGTNLAMAPTTAVAKTPATAVATAPAGGLTVAPKAGPVAPAVSTAKPNQADPNVIDVDAKDITNRQALPAPAAAPAAAAPAAQPAPASAPWTPVNPNVKPGGSKEAQAFRAQQTAQKPAAPATPTATPAAPATTSAPAKAGFWRNAAEYAADRALDYAGVPEKQRGQVHPGGHLAASRGQGTSAISRAENDIAAKLAKEWSATKTLNGNATQLTPAAIQSAANLINQAGQRLQLNFDNIVKLTTNYAQNIQQQRNAAKAREAQNQIDINRLKDELVMAEKQRRYNDVKQLSDALRQKGVSADDIENMRYSVAKSAQNIANTDIDKMLTKQPPAAPAPSTDQLRGAKPGAPTAQDYANLEKRLQQALAAQGQNK